jgi:glutaredoxin-like protein NrdH
MITLYTKPSCVQCTATHRALDAAGIPYVTVDLATTNHALEHVIALGHLQAPVVINDTTGESWSGFRPDLIDAIAVRLKENNA